MILRSIYIILLFFICSCSDLPSGFIYINDIDKTIQTDLRYSTKDNFTGRIVDGYKSNRAIISYDAAKSLVQVQNELRKRNLSLKIFDAYRPQRSVNYFINWSKDLSDTINKIIYYPKINKSQLFPMGYIAERSGHSRGSTVDLTIVNNKTNKELDMGTPYDFFGPESSTDFSNITDKQRSNRILLLEAMTKNGFKNYPKEWWHYTLELEPFNHYFNFVIE
ncbi:MAG: peptidase M15 [Flavobacteriaceae bacterium]|jgi:D-alanyl-D-alanine dipeptidase|nr:peptidase M15 [Flavobacteriaceae bacterium]|tara:strand:- start:373 stop:1035 length:663 start_codon:yes stop_codon:yes gene_type:complete